MVVDCAVYVTFCCFFIEHISLFMYVEFFSFKGIFKVLFSVLCQFTTVHIKQCEHNYPQYWICYSMAVGCGHILLRPLT